jgi:spermidine/putrescine transport system substrate-binding protein
VNRTLWVVLLALLVLVTACGGGETTSNGDTRGTADSGETTESDDSSATATAFTGNCEVSGPLRLWNWSEYMDPDIMTEFGEAYGVEVTEDNFSSNEEVITKLRAGNSGYDIVFPSDYAVALLAEEGLLATLDKENIPNIANLQPDLVGLYFDPTNDYSVPFMWGTTGIAYNENYFDTPPTSLATLFDTAMVEGQEGFFSMLDDEREAIGAALKYLGYSVNDSDPTHLAEARDILLAQKGLSQFSGYNSDNFYDTLAGEEIYYAQAWSGGAALAASENPAVRYIVPEEGGVIWMDNLAIASDSANKCTAELFINYLLDPAVAGRLVDYTYYNSPVEGALDNAAEETRALLEQGFIPDSATLERLEWIERSDDTTIYSDTWTEVKSR